MVEWLDGIDAAQFLAAGSAWSRAAWSRDPGEPAGKLAGDSGEPAGDPGDSWDTLATARRAHAETLARHGVCPVCFSRLPRVRHGCLTACRRCTRRLVRLQTPGDGPRHHLIPLVGNLYLADEVARHRVPLHRGENYVRREYDVQSWNSGAFSATVTPPLPDLED